MAGVSEELVIALKAVQGVVAGEAVDVVDAVPTGDGLRRRRAAVRGRRQGAQRGQVPADPVRELEALDAGTVSLGAVPALDGDLVGAVGVGEHEVVMDAHEREVGGRDAGAEDDDVGVAVPVPVVDGVGAVAEVEVIGVAVAGAAQQVVAGAAVVGVAPAAPVVVAPVAAAQDVVAGAADQGVAADAAIEDIVAVTAVERVVARAAVEPVISVRSFSSNNPCIAEKSSATLPSASTVRPMASR